MGTTLDGLRGAITEMADGGATLEEIASAIVETAGLDSERRAALWLYARSCTTATWSSTRAASGAAAGGGRVHASGRPSEPGRAREGEVSRMPYVRCPECGLTSYIAWGPGRAGECPGCGEVLSADGRAEVVKPGERRDGGIAGALALARGQLDMDVALLTEITDGQEVVREASGRWPELGSLGGHSMAVEDTFCNRLLEGRISNVVNDAHHDERVADVAVARDFGVGAWIGVPLEVADARLYMLCCLARESRPALGEADVRFLTGLGETIVSELEAAVRA
jgi:GAF domain-containing protein